MKKISFIFSVFFWIIGSVILIHIAGLVGIFVALAFPAMWLIMPQNTPCLFCRWKRNGEICPACGHRIDKSHFCYPRTFKSVLFNFLAILTVSLISLSVIFFENRALSYFGVNLISKTVSFVVPVQGQYRLGEVFPMKVDLDGVKTNINTVQADLKFDPAYVEVEDIVTTDSFATIFVQKQINNEVGFARISGGIPNPGANCQSNCHFASIFFKAKKPGTVQVKYLPTSLVLANDGQGSNVLKDLGSISFLVLPDKIDPTLNLNVLGAKTQENTAQLNLYQGNPILETKILGSETSIFPKNNTNFINLKWFLTNLQKFDQFVLEIWNNITTVLVV